MDGVGGNVKQLVHPKTMSKGKDRVFVQDAPTFANEARKKYCNFHKIILLKSELVLLVYQKYV